jgi:hypothetical protein
MTPGRLKELHDLLDRPRGLSPAGMAIYINALSECLAEVERLRAKLFAISVGETRDPDGDAWPVEDFAREALEGKPKP